MPESFCKFNRRKIAENLPDIHKLVIQPTFICSSCARATNDKSRLCKPTRLPAQTKQKQKSNIGKLSSVGIMSKKHMSKKQLKSELKELKKQKKKIKKRLKRAA